MTVDPSTPHQKIRRALYIALERLDEKDRGKLHDLIDLAPEPVVGRSATDEETQQQQLFKAKARIFLRTLPPETGITYQDLMKQVEAENIKNNKLIDFSPLAESPKSPRKNGKAKTKRHSENGKKRDKTTLVDYLCILDFMTTCNNGPPPKPQEIIEFPAVLLNVKTGEIEDTFHRCIKPDVHPTLSPFCTDLTGIRQDMVDKGVSLEDALALHEDWLDGHGLVSVPDALDDDDCGSVKSTFLFATCGDWDLKVCLPNQMEYHKKIVPKSFKSWINVKWPFETMFHKKAGGISDMMGEMNLESDQSTVSGLDDCRNLAQICKKMIAHGWLPNPTAGIGRIGSKQFWEVQSRRQWPPQKDPLSPYKMIYLLRHGQSESQIVGENELSSIGDLKDCGLTDKGIQEAESIHTFFSGDQIKSIQVVVTSPLKRALQTSLLGFQNHDIIVNYDLAEVGLDTPENSARAMEEVVKELGANIEARKGRAALDYKTLKPKTWPKQQASEPAARKIRKAFEWLYMDRREQTIAVVCHNNVIRSAVYGSSAPISPDNATPIMCQLFMNGNLVPI